MNKILESIKRRLKNPGIIFDIRCILMKVKWCLENSCVVIRILSILKDIKGRLENTGIVIRIRAIFNKFKRFLNNLVHQTRRILNRVKGFISCPRGDLIKFIIWILNRIVYFLNGRTSTSLMNSRIVKVIIRLLNCTKITYIFLKILGLFEKTIMWFINDLVPDDLADELAEESLKLLLKFMKLNFDVYPEHYKEILEFFEAKFLFRGSIEKPFRKSIAIYVAFNGRKVEVVELEKPTQLDKLSNNKGSEPTVTVIFDNGKAILNYLIAVKKDMARLILNNQVVLQGNVNHAMRFQYIANHLILKLTGGVY